MTVPPKIIVLLGPTASGKSALAARLAGELSAEILSVDSMQVYRGMDVGTAKPMPAERALLRHHLIDVAEANEVFTVARFAELADAVIADAAQRHVPIIATGGTPLYYKALFEGLFGGPSADESLRSGLAEQSNEQLHARLSEIDPVAATRIHANDRRRLIRAIEVFELTGQPISSLQTEWQGNQQRHEAIWFGISWERDALNRRINARVKQMITDGWVDETRSLLQKYGELSKTAAEATGYYELLQHIRGEMPLDDAVEQIKIATRQLARRQMKWFRRFLNVTWLDGELSIDQNAADVLARFSYKPRNPMNDTPARVLVLVRDLIFGSKISATAKSLNVPVQFIRNSAQLATTSADRLIVDLNQVGAIEAAAQWKAIHGGRVIGFVSHVDQATIDRAKSAGIDQILPRSQFVQLLPGLLG